MRFAKEDHSVFRISGSLVTLSLLLTLGVVAAAPSATAKPRFCDAVVEASIWTSYLASPPPPVGLSLGRVKQMSAKYRLQAIRAMRTAGYDLLADQYEIGTSRGTPSKEALRSVLVSQTLIRRECGFDPYDYDAWADVGRVLGTS